MAEIAAGALVAEQVVSTTIEGGVVAGYAVAKPTMPLKATLRQIGSGPRDESQVLARSHHTVTIINDMIYIFGGQDAEGKVCSTDMCSVTIYKPSLDDPQYERFPAMPIEEKGEVPSPRSRHAACVRGKHIVICGGCDEQGHVLDETSCFWLWDTGRMQWAQVKDDSSEDRPINKIDHRIFADEKTDSIIVHGGRTSSSGEKTRETWLFNFETRKWTRLPDAPAAPSDSAYVEGTLYTVTGGDDLGSEVHFLKIDTNGAEKGASSWHTIKFPSNPLVPGPRPREGSALLPITTGLGRQYLLYVFGCRRGTAVESDDQSSEKPEFYSDIWTTQLPSKSITPTSWTDIKPAVIKDAIREKLGYDSGAHSWGEVDVQPSEQVGHEGKVHPGPRGYFGADVCADGKTVIIWGGLNAKDEKESDGWVLSLS